MGTIYDKQACSVILCRALFLIIIISICGCAASKSTLAKEEQHINNILKSWEGKSVEEFVSANPHVESLDLGGGKVRYTTYYTPSHNVEYFIFFLRYRHYELYFFVNPSGIIYNTSWSRLYRNS